MSALHYVGNAAKLQIPATLNSVCSMIKRLCMLVDRHMISICAVTHTSLLHKARLKSQLYPSSWSHTLIRPPLTDLYPPYYWISDLLRHSDPHYENAQKPGFGHVAYIPFLAIQEPRHDLSHLDSWIHRRRTSE